MSFKLGAFSTSLTKILSIPSSNSSKNASPNSQKIRNLEEHRVLYKEGVKKFNQEFDCVKIVHSLRELKAVVKMMLDQDQQTLIRFNKDTLLTPSVPPKLSTVSNFMSRSILNHKLENVPHKDCPTDEEIRYENNVDRFMKNYKAKNLSVEDFNLMKSIV
jgi:hypothetical protein